MAIRRPGSERGAVRLALALGLALGATGTSAVETEAEAEPNPAALEAPIGASAEALRIRFGEALHAVEPVVAESAFAQLPGPQRRGAESPSPARPVAQQRLVRASDGNLQQVEYDLAEDRVYRVRWRLAERFERPVMDAVVARLTARLGEPAYDQTLRAKLGSVRADLRRAGWVLGARALEIRQLHPFNGGPFFVSLADRATLETIVAARGTPLPQPDSTGAWWRRPQRSQTLLSAAERDSLAMEVDGLVAALRDAAQAEPPRTP
jgi:hypothetical protein